MVNVLWPKSHGGNRRLPMVTERARNYANMMLPRQPLNSIPAIGAGLAIVVGTAVLAGWIFEVPLLKTLLPGFVTLKANTAIAFVLAGASLLLLTQPSVSSAPIRTAGQLLALVVTLIGALTFGEELFGWDLGIDQLLINDNDAVRVLTSAPGRMAISSAIAFFLLGLALFTIDWKPWGWFRSAELLALVVVALSSVAAIEYVFGRAVVHPLFDATRMAVHTCATFIVLGIGVLAARPESGVLGQIRARISSPLERRVYIALAVSLFALFATGAAALLSTQDSVTRAGWVDHTHQVRRQLSLLLSAHQNLQLGTRGYAITGQPEFLQPYEAGRPEVDRAYRDISALVQDNPRQTARLATLAALNKQHLEYSRRIVELRRSGDSDAVFRLIRSGEGERLMNSLRAAIAEMQAEETALLGERGSEEQASVARLNGTLAASTILALFTVIFAGAVIHRDFSQRHRAEMALRESEENLSTTLQSIGDAVLATDTDGCVTRMNPVAERLMGLPFVEARGRPVEQVFQIIHEQTRAPAVIPIATVLATGEVQGLANHTVLIGRDGTERPIADSAAPIRDAEGRVSGVVLVFRDTTAERKAEQTIREQNELLERRVRERTAQLRKSEEQLNRAQSLAHMGNIHINLQTNEINWSDETYRIFGLPRETFAPSMGEYLELVHQDDRATVLAVQEQVRQGVNPESMEYRIIRPDGTVRQIYRESEIIPDEKGQPQSLISTVHDITERHRTEAQLRQAQKMDAIGNLTGGMAHDFNNLLGIVIGNIDLLRELKKDDAEVAELTQDALDAAVSGAELTRRLLAFARQQPLQPKRVDANEMISGIARLLSRTLGEDIEISLDLATDAWETVVDPAQLEASLVNLANNSRDAMPHGGRLTIATANRQLDEDYAEHHAEVVAADYLLIEVSDTGTGMPQEVISRIFEPFFTTKARGKGTGLGLAMVFGFIKQSGGHINVYSEPGLGTTFRLYLPRMTEGDVPSEDDSVPLSVRGGGETVLVVEDNPALRRVVVRQLGELGYRVVESENAATALQAIERESVDLILTDIVMPGGTDGIELAEQARQRWPSLKVIFTSGFAETQINGTAWSLPDGAQLLTKPYRRDELARIVRAVLEG